MTDGRDTTPKGGAVATDVILLLALAIGICIFFYYAARAAFKADSRERKRTNELFAYLERTFKGDTHD